MKSDWSTAQASLGGKFWRENSKNANCKSRMLLVKIPKPKFWREKFQKFQIGRKKKESKINKLGLVSGQLLGKTKWSPKKTG